MTMDDRRLAVIADFERRRNECLARIADYKADEPLTETRGGRNLGNPLPRLIDFEQQLADRLHALIEEMKEELNAHRT